MKSALIAQMLLLGSEPWVSKGIQLDNAGAENWYPDASEFQQMTPSEDMVSEENQQELAMADADMKQEKIQRLVINQYNGHGGNGKGWAKGKGKGRGKGYGKKKGGKGWRSCPKGKKGRKCRQNKKEKTREKHEKKGKKNVPPVEDWMLKKLAHKSWGTSNVVIKDDDDKSENFKGKSTKVSEWDFDKVASGDPEIEWTFNNGAAGFRGGHLKHMPDFDFEISFDFLTSQKKKNQGMFSICAKWNCRKGHDRHIGLSKDGKLYVRVWRGKGWWTKQKGYNDGKWHTLKLSVTTKGGQKLFLDNKLIGTNKYNHSDFNWKDVLLLGYSRDLKHRFTGKIRNLEYKSLEEEEDKKDGVKLQTDEEDDSELLELHDDDITAVETVDDVTEVEVDDDVTDVDTAEEEPDDDDFEDIEDDDHDLVEFAEERELEQDLELAEI